MEANAATLSTEVSKLQKNVNIQKYVSITTLVVGILGFLATAIETPFAFLYFESVAVALMAATGLSMAPIAVLMISAMLVPAIIGILAAAVSLIFFIVKKVSVKKLDQKEIELKEAKNKGSKPETDNKPKTKGTKSEKTGENSGIEKKKTEETTSDLSENQKNSLNLRIKHLQNLNKKENTLWNKKTQETTQAILELKKLALKIEEIDPILEIMYYKENSVDVKDFLKNSTVFNFGKRSREKVFQIGIKFLNEVPFKEKACKEGLFTRFQNNKNTDPKKGTILFNKIKKNFQMENSKHPNKNFLGNYIKTNNWKDLTLLLLDNRVFLK